MTTAIRPQVTPEIFGEPQLHTDGELLTLAFAPDGTLWSVEDPGVLRHWNASNGEQLEWFSLSDLETLWCFSQDARVLASATDDLTLWDTSSGQVLTALPQPSWVSALAFHPRPDFLATGHDDGVVRYWDAAGHRVLHEWPLHKNTISALAFSKDGKFLASAGEDKIIAIWDVASGKHLGTLQGHRDRIPALAWHPGGQFLVSAGWDTTARVWDIAKKEPRILLNSHDAQVTALAFSHDGSMLASADSAPSVHLWDFNGNKTIHKLKGPQGEIRFLAFSPDAKKLASSGEGLIHLWDPHTGKLLAGSGVRTSARTTVALSGDGNRLASNGGGSNSRVWNVQTHQAPLTLEERDARPTVPVHALGFSPDGRWLAGAAEKHLRLWDASSGKIKCDLEGPNEPITCLAFSPDSAQLASGSNMGLAVWLWRLADGEPVLLIPDALDGCTIEALAFHPQGRLLAVGGIDWLATGGSTGALCLWDLVDRCEVATFPGGCTSLAVHPSGQRIASASTDQSICLWDLNKKDILGELIGHDGNITCLAFSPDGKWLISGAEDRTLRLWTEDGDEKAALELDSQPTSLAYSPDGQFLYTGNANTTCYKIKMQALMQNG